MRREFLLMKLNNSSRNLIKDVFKSYKLRFQFKKSTLAGSLEW